MVRIQHIGAPNNGDTLQVIAQLKHNAIDVISMAEKDLPILIQRGVRGDVGPFALFRPPISKRPFHRPVHANHMLRRRADNLAFPFIGYQYRRDISARIAKRFGLPDQFPRVLVKSDHRRLVARRRINHLIIIYQRTLRGSPVASLPSIDIATVHFPDDLAILDIQANDLTGTADHISLVSIDSRRGACLRIGIAPRRAIGHLIHFLPVQGISGKDLLGLILVHSREIQAIAYDHRTGVSLAGIHRFP